MKDKSEILDKVEEILIDALLPTVRVIKQEVSTITTDDKTVARNLIAKVGTRLMFGKSEETDKILLGDK